ncbi:3-hydroxyanthranilic acid dioxygenase-domain-containing protein [Peziza echinospora]|nr:3-hydroxyanthranilic acid dioxygenase-domain-containing protein [Peziza echinospora]
MALPNPLNLPKWLKENGHLLQPPINNFCVYDKGVTVMVVGGPNARNDYHINETPEWFFQYKGRMLLKVVEPAGEAGGKGVFRDIYIDEGEMFLLPPNIPHNPVRFADTVGIVLEQPRPAKSLDRLRWYCPNADCRAIVHEAAFHCIDLGSQIKIAVNEFKARDVEGRRCRECGGVVEAVMEEKEVVGGKEREREKEKGKKGACLVQ